MRVKPPALGFGSTGSRVNGSYKINLTLRESSFPFSHSVSHTRRESVKRAAKLPKNDSTGAGMASFTQMEWIWPFHWHWKPSSGNFSSLQTKFNYLLRRSVVTITLCSGEMLHSQEQHHRTPIWWRRNDCLIYLKCKKWKKQWRLGGIYCETNLWPHCGPPITSQSLIPHIYCRRFILWAERLDVLFFSSPTLILPDAEHSSPCLNSLLNSCLGKIFPFPLLLPFLVFQLSTDSYLEFFCLQILKNLFKIENFLANNRLIVNWSSLKKRAFAKRTTVIGLGLRKVLKNYYILHFRLKERFVNIQKPTGSSLNFIQFKSTFI